MADNSMSTNDEEVSSDGILLKKARAKSKGGTLTSDVQPGQFVLPNAIQALRERAAAAYEQGQNLFNAEPDMSQLQAYAKSQGEAGQAATLNALAAQFAGEGFQPIQAQYLKRAAAAQEPMKIAGGVLTSDGKFIKDPGAMQERRAEFLLRQGQALEQMATQAEGREAERLRREGQDAQNNALRWFVAQTGRMNAGNGAAGSFAPTGFTPNGESIVTNSKNGLTYIVRSGPDGVPSYTPYQGANIPKASYEKQVGEAGSLAGSAFAADRLIKQVENNPGSFGLKGAAVSMLPGGLQGYGAQAVKLTPEQMAIRANVLRDAALEINNLYGAALSMGEDARAKTFIPDAKDPPETVITKLKAARDWASTKLKAMPQGVQNASGARHSEGGAEDPNDPLGWRQRFK